MYRQVIIPTTKEHSIELPENLYGKQVEVTVKEIVTKPAKLARNKNLPTTLKNKLFWDSIEYNPTFPSVDDLRKTAWPKKKLVILDTDILIEIIRKNIPIIQKCDKLGTNNLAISSITFSEFLAGSRDKVDLQRNIKFLSKFKLLPVNKKIDTLFIDLYKTYAISHRPGIPDMLIAATALHYKHSVLTQNKRHFRFISGLQLI